MHTVFKCGLTLALAVIAFTFNALKPKYFETSPYITPVPILTEEDTDSEPQPPKKISVLMTLSPSADQTFSVDALPAWERFVLALRRTADQSVHYLGHNLEAPILFGSPRTRGYTAIIGTFATIGALGLLVGHRHNVNHPHDGPSFSFSLLAGKIGLIATCFFACAWLRDLAVANIGDASILAILALSIGFAIFAGITAFSRAN